MLFCCRATFLPAEYTYDDASKNCRFFFSSAQYLERECDEGECVLGLRVNEMRMRTFRRLLFVAAVAATNCVTAAPLSHVSSNTTRDSLRQSTDTAAGMVNHMMDYMKNMIPSIENEVGGLPSTFSSQVTHLMQPSCKHLFSLFFITFPPHPILQLIHAWLSAFGHGNEDNTVAPTVL